MEHQSRSAPACLQSSGSVRLEMAVGALAFRVTIKATFIHVEDLDGGSPTARRRSASSPPEGSLQGQGRRVPAALVPRSPAADGSLPPSTTSGAPTTIGSDESAPTLSERGRTTVMMRSIPEAITRDDLLGLIDREGFSGDVDFLYLPVDFKTKASSGFAFINLRSPALARRFHTHFSRFSSWGVPLAKRCNMSWAREDQQGLAANVARYRNSSVMHSSVSEEHRPVLLRGGKPVAFPPPTRPLWPPHTDFGARAGRRSR